MSLSADGIWKAGVWAETVWADGVWFEGAAAAVATAKPSGGWAMHGFYDRYLAEQQERDEERKQVKKSLESLDKTDADIARLLHRQLEREARDAEIASLEAMVSSSYTKRQGKLASQYNERVAKAYIRAATQGNFSSLEAFEREMDRAREEEEFLLIAMVVLN